MVGSTQRLLAVKPTNKPNASITTPSTPMVSAEVNAIQSTQTLGNKKKGKGKNKKPGNQQENTNTAATNNANEGERQVPFLFMWW